MVLELSGVQFGLKSYAWFEITSMISDQNCTTRGSITTLLHPFWNRPNTGLGQFKYFIDAVLSRSEIKFIHFLGGKSKSFGNKSCKICHMILFVFHFPAIWSVTWKILFERFHYFQLPFIVTNNRSCTDRYNIMTKSSIYLWIYDYSNLRFLLFSGDLCKSGPRRFASEKKFCLKDFAYQTIFGSK